MGSSPATEDYYMVLEVEQTATPELIIRSYKRLALKLHPDRNTKHDATVTFQLLGQAYETLKDEVKRRAYDLIYPSITRGRPSPQTAQTPRPSPAPNPQSEALSEAAQILALEKSKRERDARWFPRKNSFDSSIFEIRRDIRRLEQDIKNLESIVAAEAAVEAQKNNWGTWFLSPIFKKAEDSEEEKARKDRERQERRIEKDMKERRLGSKKTDLMKAEDLLKKAKDEVDAAHLVDDGKIRVIQYRMDSRRKREWQERERVERERVAKIWQQQQEQQKQREERMREAAEALRKQRAEEERAAEQKRHEAQIRERQRMFDDETKRRREQYSYSNLSEDRSRQSYTSACRHDGWWPKVEGRKACPNCSELWTYMLRCPSCKIEACPKFQAALRPRQHRHTARTSQRDTPRARSPGPDFDFDYYDY